MESYRKLGLSLVHIRRWYLGDVGDPLPHGFTGVLLLCLVAAGCASQHLPPPGRSEASGTIASGFPSREAIADIAGRDAPAARPASPVVAAPWTIDAARVEHSTKLSHTAWTDLVAHTFLQRDGVTASAGLQCAAREAARFRLERRASPDIRVLRFLVGRCGETIPAPAVTYWTGEAPDSASDSEVFKAWESAITGLLGDIGPKQSGTFGTWLERRDGNVALAIVYGVRSAFLDQGTTEPDRTNVVRVRGKLQNADTLALALINQGSSGVKVCSENAALPLPDFEFTCPMAEGDRVTWIEVLSGRPERPLLRGAASLLVRVPGEAALAYAPSVSEGDEIRDETTFRREVLIQVNVLRAAAKLQSVTLADGQSQTNTRLAGHFFRAVETGDEDRQDVLALGMLAGWDVQGTILDGGFYAMWLGGVRRPDDWVSGVLEFPSARYTLLNPGMHSIAIGPHFGDGSVGAIITAFALPDEHDISKTVREVAEHLRVSRVRGGVSGPVAVTNLRGIPDALNDLRAARREPDDVINRLLQQVTTEQERGATAFLIHTQRFDAIEWPRELLRPGPVEVAIGVTVVRPAGMPWGHYAVLVIVLQGVGRIL